jgi:hypothetical protein
MRGERSSFSFKTPGLHGLFQPHLQIQHFGRRYVQTDPQHTAIPVRRK